MCSIKYIDGKESNAAKGVNIATEFKELKDTLLNKKIMRHKMRRIQSKKHRIGTYEIDKISLLCFYDKRFVLEYGIHTLAYFHKDVKNKLSQMTIKKWDSNRYEEILKDSHKKRDSHKKKRFSHIKRRDSHKWLKVKISAYK